MIKLEDERPQSFISISLKEIGEEKLHEQLLIDIDFLLDLAIQKHLDPVCLVVGPLFVEIASVIALIKDEDILDWESYVDLHSHSISKILYEKVLEIYQVCEQKNCRFGKDSQRNLHVYFDPDEEYMYLKALDDENCKILNKNPKAAFKYTCLRLRKDEILIDYVLTGIN